MNFGSNHYVPILKAKRGEKRALPAVSDALRPYITPFFEIVERNEDKAATIEAHLDTTFKGLAAAVGPYRRCFLDVREIAPDGSGAAAAAFERAANEGMVFTPVTGISRRTDIAAALVHRTNGLALRLTREEYGSGSLATNIRSFMVRHGLSQSEVDLIVDLGPVNDLVHLGVERLAGVFLADVPDMGRWRTVTLSACAFPWSMGGVDRNSHRFVERTEWKAWRQGLCENRKGLVRLPAFSDCAIQHTSGVEGFDYRKMSWSAAIRYSCGDDWLLIKGESTKLTLPSKQFPRLASQLVYGHLRGRFSGASHCNGCSGLRDYAAGGPGAGSAENLRRVGTIHHLTVVAEAMAALPLP